MRLFVYLLSIVTTFFIVLPTFACTGLTLTAKNGDYVFGRTLEFGAGLLNFELLAVPRNFDYKGITPKKNAGLKWQTKYSHVGFGLKNHDVILDGINDQGLSAGVFYFPGYAEFQKCTDKNNDISLSVHQLVSWILGTCATVEDVKQKLPRINVVGVKLAELGIVPPLHFSVNDKAGNSIVIEYIKGKLTIHDNLIGVITNSPDFSWHMTNLHNYIGLKSISDPSLKIKLKNKDQIIAPFGGGSGAFGLPGDFTPPSRFVRATFFKLNAKTMNNANDAVFQIFHILNQFDIPAGSVVYYKDNDKRSENGKNTEITVWTSACDLRNLVYYFHTFTNRHLQMIDLKKIKWTNGKILRFNSQKKEIPNNITDNFCK